MVQAPITARPPRAEIRPLAAAYGGQQRGGPVKWRGSAQRDLHTAEVQREHQAHLPASKLEHNASRICKLRCRSAARHGKAGAKRGINALDVTRGVEVGGRADQIRSRSADRRAGADSADGKRVLAPLECQGPASARDPEDEARADNSNGD